MIEVGQVVVKETEGELQNLPAIFADRGQPVLFGSTFPTDGNVDVPEGTLRVAFNVDVTCPPVFGDLAVEVPVTPDVASVVVAVDEDTSEGLAPQLYGMIDAGQPVPLIPSE